MIAVQEIATPLSQAHRRALAQAVDALENPNFAARLADYAGASVNRVVQMLPRRASKGLSRAVEVAIQKCLKTAIGSLDPAPGPPIIWFSNGIAGITGGVSGFFGMPALVVELPLTTTIMLRAIADIARRCPRRAGSGGREAWPRDWRRADSRVRRDEVHAGQVIGKRPCRNLRSRQNAVT
jgi:hypothetical protein